LESGLQETTFINGVVIFEFVLDGFQVT
jgi:hypothetical protein